MSELGLREYTISLNLFNYLNYLYMYLYSEKLGLMLEAVNLT